MVFIGKLQFFVVVEFTDQCTIFWFYNKSAECRINIRYSALYLCGVKTFLVEISQSRKSTAFLYFSVRSAVSFKLAGVQSVIVFVCFHQ